MASILSRPQCVTAYFTKRQEHELNAISAVEKKERKKKQGANLWVVKFSIQKFNRYSITGWKCGLPENTKIEITTLYFVISRHLLMSKISTWTLAVSNETRRVPLTPQDKGITIYIGLGFCDRRKYIQKCLCQIHVYWPVRPTASLSNCQRY